MIDRAVGFELVERWLPDFIAYWENALHPLADDMLKRARERVIGDYASVTEYDDHKLVDATLQVDYACDDVLVMLDAVAEWIVAGRISDAALEADRV